MVNQKKIIFGIVVASAAAIGLYSLAAKAAPPGEFGVEILEMDES